jgi:hypothetical protein
MMNSVSSSNFTVSTPLLDYEENEVCHKFSPILVTLGCFTFSGLAFIIYYSVFM